MPEKEMDSDELAKELAFQLELLRQDFSRTVERYRTTVEAELVNLISLLRGDSTGDEVEKKPEVETLKFLLELIASTRYKKDKGRFKDIRRIHELVKTISNRLEST
ncbi:MAG: hypothetical protein ONB24_01175 [candidate division KSB1 bacterium]|nr:hypothetical protein [candidate division KSB1 bacterium]